MFLLKKHIFFFSVVLFLRASSGVLNIIIQSVVLALDMDRLVSNTRLGNQLFFWLELLWSLSVLLSYLLSFCLDSAPWITLASFGWISLPQYHVFQKIYRLRVSFSFFLYQFKLSYYTWHITSPWALIPVSIAHCHLVLRA